MTLSKRIFGFASVSIYASSSLCQNVGKGADTKIELGFSMTLAGAIPGIHPEGRRLGALRLGRRLETPKSQVWFLPITGEAVIGDGFYDILCAPHAASGKYQPTASYDAVRRHQNSGLRQKNSAPRLRFVASSAFLGLCTRSPLARGGAVRCVTLVDMVWRPYGRTSVRAMGR